MILIELQYLILIFRESEKIILLLQVFERLVRMVSALPFDEITLLLECFTADTVESLVDSLIDISGIIRLLEYLLDIGMMSGFCRTDEVSIAYPYTIPDSSMLRRHHICILHDVHIE